jgi:hypothetical protein
MYSDQPAGIEPFDTAFSEMYVILGFLTAIYVHGIQPNGSVVLVEDLDGHDGPFGDRVRGNVELESTEILIRHLEVGDPGPVSDDFALRVHELPAFGAKL